MRDPSTDTYISLASFSVPFPWYRRGAWGWKWLYISTINSLVRSNVIMKTITSMSLFSLYLKETEEIFSFYNLKYTFGYGN